MGEAIFETNSEIFGFGRRPWCGMPYHISSHASINSRFESRSFGSSSQLRLRVENRGNGQKRGVFQFEARQTGVVRYFIFLASKFAGEPASVLFIIIFQV